MSDRVPRLIDPFRMIEKRGFFKSKLFLNEFERLKEYLVDDEGSAEFELSFGKEGKVSVAKGLVSANLMLRCQICLEGMVWTVQNNINLGIISSIDEAKMLPDEYEPLVLSDNRLAISKIIEDELLLALPTIPKHPDCRVRKRPSQEPVRENPFSVLRQLKN